ncbi:MAG: twin-arginine translocase TatA/TatE family subunit [Candidatus Omnitrophica bacterium]|nr:twin-arginine translocase TatA/TatE family subunit [Candidatus Omnitrophota bacterium]
MGRIGLPEILLILVVILLFFGVKRLPEIGNSLGKAIREFQKAMKGGNDPDNKNEKTS